MKTLLDAARQKKTGLVRKVMSYYDEYDFNLRDYRDRPITLLEIGIQRGGSLHMWREYFSQATIIGVDIDSSCAAFADGDKVRVEIGDQSDRAFLQMLKEKYGPFDIVIDDGGHTMAQQMVSIEALFPAVTDGGMYVIEDLHTSYWPAFGGRLGKKRTAVGFLKGLIDQMHYWAIDNPRASFVKRALKKIQRMRGDCAVEAAPQNIWQRDVRSIHIADSICFIRKGKVERNKVVAL